MKKGISNIALVMTFRRVCFFAPRYNLVGVP